jgi:hypothetical protein
MRLGSISFIAVLILFSGGFVSGTIGKEECLVNNLNYEVEFVSRCAGTWSGFSGCSQLYAFHDE